MDFVPGAEDRIADAARRARLRLRGRLGPLPRRRRASTTPATTSGSASGDPDERLAPLLRDRSPRRRARASSTSSPTPTWSRSGARAARCPTATRASTTSPPSRRSPSPGSRSRSRPPACASRSARSTRRRPSRRCASRPAPPFALSSDAHVPEQVGFGYERARRDFCDDLGVDEIGVFERRERRHGAARLMPGSGSATTATASSEGRRLVLGGVEIEHERGLAGHSDADVLTHAVIDALLGAAGARRPRHALSRPTTSAGATPTRSTCCAPSLGSSRARSQRRRDA